MNESGDIILVVGPSAAGKTDVLNDLRESCRIHGIPYMAKAVSDAHTILDRMREDDREGGHHHTHDWCARAIQGHTHLRREPTLPFTVTSNIIPDRMYSDFFARLATLPQTAETWFAEWSGGINTNPPEEAASRADFSYGRIGKKLFWEEYDDSWIPRVRAIIHPVTERSVRFALNAKRGIPSEWQIEYGTASWPLTDTGMNIFGEDDFETIRHQFFRVGIPVYEIRNDGDNGFRRELHAIKRDLFPHHFQSVERHTTGRRPESDLP